MYSQPAAELQNSASDGAPLKSLESMIMDDFFRNIYGDNVPAVASSSYAGGGEGSAPPVKGVGFKTSEEVWREITSGQQAEGASGVAGLVSESESKDAGEMTLEDFLARAGSAIEEEVSVPSGVLTVDPAATDQYVQQPLTIENSVPGFQNGMDVVPIGGGRGRRRPLIDPEDRVTMQRQKRMIKNRESAARSRERKQAYTAELETLVHQLEHENELLHIELEQRNKERLKQLLEMAIPVTTKKKPPSKLRRTNTG